MNKVKQFGPALLTLLILGAIVGFARIDMVTAGVPQYMAKCQDAIYAIPKNIGPWQGEARPLDARAKDLLKPNAEISMLYRHSVNRQEAFFTVVQVTDARNITGHAPENCYPGTGWTILEHHPRTWKVGGMEMQGVEYMVERKGHDNLLHRWNVRSIFVYPDGHWGSTLRDLDRAAENYRQLKYGVSHIQVVTNGAPVMTPQMRDDVFYQLVGSEKSVQMIRTLQSGIPR